MPPFLFLKKGELKGLIDKFFDRYIFSDLFRLHGLSDVNNDNFGVCGRNLFSIHSAVFFAVSL